MIKSILLLAALFSWQSVNAASYTVDSGTSSVEFLAVGRPSMIKIKGTGAKPSGTFITDSSSGSEIKVDLNQFTTGMSLRDRHMKEKYLETAKPGNQFAILKISKIDLSGKELPASGEIPAKISGTLTLHGKTLPVSSDAKLKIDGAKLSSDVNLKLKLTDYGVEIPSFAGVTVAADVDVDVKLLANRNPK
jgi:polyisoprenoid-binding protein YceI